jgi:flagellar basal-body rod protein FlgB
MIEALFNQVNYIAAKKLLDATTLRQEAIASNLANIETPGYRRIDTSSSFTAELQQAISSKNPDQIAGLQPRLEVDASAIAANRDGNTVQLETELSNLQQNSIEHALETQLITSSLLKLRLAITGRPS